MAGVASKRQRDETHIEEISEGEELKRQKSFDQIISLLDEEEEEASEDLSSIITTLQQEISSTDPQETETNPENSNSSFTLKEDEEGESERERVMRHLLEASDDELGIPNGDVFLHEDGFERNGLSLCDALWEMEDEAANYYTLFQSQLFM